MQKNKSRLKALLTYLPIIIVLVAIDLIIKYFAKTYLRPIDTIPFIDGILHFTYVHNPGAAFGILRGSSQFLIYFTGVILLGLIIYLVSAKIKSKIEIVSLILIISGGLGNLVDRALNGHVVDYIQALPAFIDFPVFNFADCLVTVGSFFLIGFLLYDIFKEFKNSKKELPHAESAVSEENALPAETGEISEKADESEESESVSEKTSDETA